MQLIDIKDGCVILHLTPPQCASLAKACQFAGHSTLSEEIDHWRTFAALFYACAVASFSQWHMAPIDASEVDQQLEMSGLGTVEVEQVDLEILNTLRKLQKANLGPSG
jgi:hypothetical protein